MKRETVNYTLVGVVVLAALAVLLFALTVITGRGGATVDYQVVYRNVTGLAYGAPVFYEGFRIGQVDSIEPERRDNRTYYRVGLSVREDWPIPGDSIARLSSSGLLADVAIAIREGSSAEMLAAGAEIKGEEGADVFAALNELAGEVSTLTRNRITPLVETLSTRIDSITQSVDLQTPVILGEAQSLLKRLNDAAASANDLLGKGNRDNVAATLASVRRITEELNGTQDRLDELMVQLNGMAEENRPAVRDSVQDLSQITAALARRIEAISQNLESSSRNLDELTREVRKNPNRLLFTPEADDVIVEEE